MNHENCYLTLQMLVSFASLHTFAQVNLCFTIYALIVTHYVQIHFIAIQKRAIAKDESLILAQAGGIV
jgi:hypothetical protein